MHPDIRKIRPLGRDVTLCLEKERDVQKSAIYYEDDTDSKTLQYFRVIRIGDDVKFLKEGDLVVCSYLKITQPQLGILDGVKRQFGLTEEKEVLAVIND